MAQPVRWKEPVARVVRGRPKLIFVLAAVFATIFEVDLGRSSIDPDQCEKYHVSSPEFSSATAKMQRPIEPTIANMQSGPRQPLAVTPRAHLNEPEVSRALANKQLSITAAVFKSRLAGHVSQSSMTVLPQHLPVDRFNTAVVLWK